jgi:hypothetical protein
MRFRLEQRAAGFIALRVDTGVPAGGWISAKRVCDTPGLMCLTAIIGFRLWKLVFLPAWLLFVGAIMLAGYRCRTWGAVARSLMFAVSEECANVRPLSVLRLGAGSGWALAMRTIKCLKGIWWMPWHAQAMKDVIRCDKPWGAANKLWSVDFRMGQPTFDAWKTGLALSARVDGAEAVSRYRLEGI